MQRYILKRILEAAVVIWVVSLIAFLLVYVSGDPLALVVPPEATQEEYNKIRHDYGFDQPLYVQYMGFLGRAIRGDLGKSIRANRPTIELYLEKLPATLMLAGGALGFAAVLGISIGVLSALKPGGRVDTFGKVFALLGQAAPSFWVGIMLILVFAVTWRVFPAGGRDSPLSFILPAFTLGWYSTAALTRLSRSAMLDVLDSEYVKMARIKGVPEMSVIWKHAFRNATIPVVTLMSLQMIGLLSGSVIVESVFAWPGVGMMAVSAVLARDFPVVQTVVIITSALYVVVNLLVDVLYGYLDPRIRLQ